MLKSRIFAVVLVLLTAFEATGQNTAVADSCLVRISRQSAFFPQEKIHVQTDKGAYLSGERIWLRAHLVNASDGRPSSISRYVYVELLNPFSELVERIMLRPDSLGVFAGHIDLKEELPEGGYTIRSYTRYMQNQGPQAFYRKQVQVLDPYSLQMDTRAVFSFMERGMSARFTFTDRNSGTAAYPAIVTVKLPGKAEQSLKNREGVFAARLPSDAAGGSLLLGISWQGRKYQKYISIPARPGEFDVSLLPEGGYLVPGRACRIGVKALGQDGLGLNVSGIVLDSKGKQAASFGNLYKGLGSFIFKAAAGEHYTAVCTAEDGSVRSFPLPDADPAARTLQLQLVRNRLNISLLRGPDAPAEDLYLMVHQGGRAILCTEWKQDMDYTTLDLSSIPQDVLKAGIVNFVLIDSDFNVISERIFFHFGDSAPDKGVSPEKAAYGTRQLVRLKINSAGGAALAVGVTDSQSAVPDPESIVSTLLLSSEINGNIEGPADFFTPEGRPLMDALMLTQAWRRYDIPQALKGNYTRPSIKAEKYQELSGHAEGFVFNTMKDGRVSLYATLESMTSMDYATLTRDGRFSFATEFPDGTQITVQSQTRKGLKGNILEIDQKEYPTVTGAALRAPAAPVEADAYMKQADEEYLRQHGIRATMLDAAVVAASIEEKPSDSIWYSELNSTRPLTSAEIEKMHFTDILSLFLNTPGVTVRHGSSGNYLTTSRSDLPALPVIDDVVLPEYDVMSLNPEDIDNIFVIKDYTSQFGYYPGYSGAVVIKTSRGEIGTPPKSYNIARVRPLGYQRPAEFWSPKYEMLAEKESAVPDLRTTIYWNPEVVVSPQGECTIEFWTADRGTEYSICGEGVSAEGEILTVHRIIRIEEK